MYVSFKWHIKVNNNDFQFNENLLFMQMKKSIVLIYEQLTKVHY